MAQEIYQAHTHVQLISEQDAVVPGKTFWVGFDLLPDSGWHLYWKNPGDSGLSPRVKWFLPQGFKAGAIQWPYPQHLSTGPLVNFGYNHRVLLLVPISVDKEVPLGQKIDLRGRLEWLTCREECIPGRADLDLPVALVASSEGYNHFKDVFDQTRLDLPQSLSSVTSGVFLTNNQWHMDIQTGGQGRGKVTFYPFRGDIIEHAADQHSAISPHGYHLLLTKSHLYQPGSIKSLEGIAVNPEGWEGQGRLKAVVINAPIGLPPAHISFFIACLFALIGGLVLNLMPCVLPVLSIKVLHLVERHPDKRIAMVHSLFYALGILATVWGLALLLFIFKSAGQFAGWGFQFQSPVFVLAVAAILFVLALNLFGVFEFYFPAISVSKSKAADLQGSFISGVVTTIVASPCTAPFMGTALTVGLSQPNIIGFVIFTFLGLGLAMPFIILSAFPSLLSFIPKPGKWMLYLKRALGAILLACVLWLTSVFGLQTGLWDLSKIYPASAGISWQPFSSTAVDKARQSGRGVFLDFTAAWCINCQVNDRLVLQNKKVVKAFKDNGIIGFKGDWTKYDPAVTKALAAFGRDSIPVYVYYAPNSSLPVILPQLITPEKIINQIQGHR